MESGDLSRCGIVLTLGLPVCVCVFACASAYINVCPHQCGILRACCAEKEAFHHVFRMHISSDAACDNKRGAVFLKGRQECFNNSPCSTDTGDGKMQR